MEKVFLKVIWDVYVVFFLDFVVKKFVIIYNYDNFLCNFNFK